MNKTDKAEDALSCPFCKEKFSDVVKSIPECGNYICRRCYEELKEDIDQETNEYKCLACGERHKLPPSELHDSKALIVALGKINSLEKPLHPNAKKLRDFVRKVEDQMEKLQAFNCKQFIDFECDRLEQEVRDAIESAANHLEEIQKLMIGKISEYREKCFENLSKKSSEPENTTKQELTGLEEEVKKFNARWNDYFTRIEAYESEDNIKAALHKTEVYMSSLESLEERRRKRALNWQKMMFQVNSQFLEEWNHVGEIEIIAEPKMTIQETPSFTLTGHSSWVRQVVFLPDGRLASCSDDNTIKIWNVENGKELFQLKGHTYSVYSIALLPNGHLASGSYDRTIKIWDLEQRKEIRSIQAHSDAVLSLKVLKNGNLASYSCDDTIKIWNLNSNRVFIFNYDGPVSTMRGHGNTHFLGYRLFGILSNDYLVTCSRHEEEKEECILRVWNPNEPNPVKSVPTGFSDTESLLVLSNDQVALGFDKRGTIKIIDLNDDALSRTKEKAHDWGVFSLAQLSNGNLVSAGKDDSNYTIKVWNLIDWSLLQTINTGHSDWIWSMSISGDEKFLASGSDDKTIKLWPISIE